MSTKDLVSYVMDDLDRYYDKMSDTEFIDEAQNYWEDHFDEVVEEIEEYMNSDFKKDYWHIGDRLMKVFTIQFTEDELTELENVLDQHVYAEAIENKGSEGTIGTIHNRILDVHYQNSDGIVPVQEVAHRHFRKDLDLL